MSEEVKLSEVMEEERKLDEKLQVDSKQGVSVKKKEKAWLNLVEAAKGLARTDEEKEEARLKLVGTAEKLARTAKEKERVRLKLVGTAKDLARTAKEKEETRVKLVKTAENLARTAKEKERVRLKLVEVTKKLARTAKEKERVRLKLVGIAKKLARTAKEKERVRLKLAEVTKNLAKIAKEKVRLELVGTAEKLAETAKKEEMFFNELEKVNKELKNLDLVKTDFLNMVSHELKTPLTAMSAHLEILEDERIDSDGNSQVNKSIYAIKRNNKQLGMLISNLLEISRIQSRTLELNIEKLDAAKVAFEVIDDLEALMELDKVKIIKKCNKVPKVSVDRQRLVEVFNNLLSNAIKFTDKGYIRIGCKKKGEFVVFNITDTGMGIKKEQISHLFDKFYQASDNSIKHGGTGLGLPITKQLLELQGGDLSVKSVYGKGSTFTIRLPIKYKESKEYVSFGAGKEGEKSAVI